MQFYAITPYDFEPLAGRETFEGLQAALDGCYGRYGGRALSVAQVRNALTVGGGACLIKTEAGTVILERDEGAASLAKQREKTDLAEDGRLRAYKGEVTIIRIAGASQELYASRQIEGEGLMGLMRAAAEQVFKELGELPDCMSKEQVEAREKTIRTQISNAKSRGFLNTAVNFPAMFDGNNTFRIKGADWHVTVTITTKEPEAPKAREFTPFKRRD